VARRAERDLGTRDRVPHVVLVAFALMAGASPWLGGCASDCCTVDSMPIPLARAPRGDGLAPGALLARAMVAGGVSFPMLVDTATPVTILAGDAQGVLSPVHRSFDLLDATATEPAPVRASFRDIGTFTFPLGPVGDAATVPGGVLGGDVLRMFSVEFRFGALCPGAAIGAPGNCSALTFWRHQGASLGFLEDAGYAVLRFTPFGGGETSSKTGPDAVGVSGPVTLPATRIVLRGSRPPTPHHLYEFSYSESYKKNLPTNTT
jgi:hypothetical protein